MLRLASFRAVPQPFKNINNNMATCTKTLTAYSMFDQQRKCKHTVNRENGLIMFSVIVAKFRASLYAFFLLDKIVAQDECINISN